jgi:hypothetical protein
LSFFPCRGGACPARRFAPFAIPSRSAGILAGVFLFASNLHFVAAMHRTYFSNCRERQKLEGEQREHEFELGAKKGRSMLRPYKEIPQNYRARPNVLASEDPFGLK